MYDGFLPAKKANKIQTMRQRLLLFRFNFVRAAFGLASANALFAERFSLSLVSLDGFVMCEWWWWSCVMSLCIVMRDETGWFICVKEHTGCGNGIAWIWLRWILFFFLLFCVCFAFNVCISLLFICWLLWCFSLPFFYFVNRLRSDIVWVAFYLKKCLGERINSNKNSKIK